MNSHTPHSFIAGRVPSAKGRALQCAHSSAATLLGTRHLAIVCSEQDGQAWYLGALTGELASHTDSACPLAAALPGNPQHRGDGAYLAELGGGLQAVVLKSAMGLRSFVGTPALVDRFLAIDNVTIRHTCTEASVPWQFPAAGKEPPLHRWMDSVSLCGLFVALAALAVWYWAVLGMQNILTSENEAQALQLASLKTAAQAMELTTYPPALGHLQKAVEQAAREGGKLVQFEHKDSRSTWTLMVNDHAVNGSAP
jgi:hypothetical protein